ncbi:hypothetical protein HZA39_00320, partial [Candidatus Peregrinibacteria bacterium]|nr:hypothetical protein [Candidatus Peregrinibacteria bacterium]
MNFNNNKSVDCVLHSKEVEDFTKNKIDESWLQSQIDKQRRICRPFLVTTPDNEETRILREIMAYEDEQKEMACKLNSSTPFAGAKDAEERKLRADTYKTLNLQWAYGEGYSFLLENHLGKWAAINNRKVLAVADSRENLKNLISEMVNKGEITQDIADCYYPYHVLKIVHLTFA